jgi:hypothetical protein
MTLLPADGRAYAYMSTNKIFFSRDKASANRCRPDEDVFSSGGCSNLLYRSVSTVEDDGADADEPEEQLLDAEEGEDPRRTRSVCEHRHSHGGNTMSRSKTATPLNGRWCHGGGGVRAEVARAHRGRSWGRWRGSACESPPE